MWSDTADGRGLVAQLSYDVVGAVAPEEQEIFDELLEEYYQPPITGGRPPESNDPLGFGLEGMVHVATPAVIALVTTFLNHVFTEAMKTLQDESVEAVKQKIKALFAVEKKEKADAPGEVPPEPKAKLIAFEREQLALIRKAAIQEARKRGASAEEAERMANALFVRLTLA